MVYSTDEEWLEKCLPENLPVPPFDQYVYLLEGHVVKKRLRPGELGFDGYQPDLLTISQRDENELRTLEIVRQYTSIPVPKLVYEANGAVAIQARLESGLIRIDSMFSKESPASQSSKVRSGIIFPIDLQRLTAMNPPFLAASTNATLLRYAEVYQPNYVWVALLAVSAVFLACLGVVGACLRIFTITPNMFDPVMGLTFTNPYLPACAAPGPLDAVDRLKSIRDERVRIGRVGDGGMGKGIAFGDVSHVAPLT